MPGILCIWKDCSTALVLLQLLERSDFCALPAYVRALYGREFRHTISTQLLLHQLWSSSIESVLQTVSFQTARAVCSALVLH